MTPEEITKIAEQYSRRFNPGSIAPFPYENVLATHKDLEIHYADLEDDNVSGVTLFEKGRYTILINSAKPDTRQHFTLGHELGHYFLHKDYLQSEKGVVDQDAWLDGPNMLFRADDIEKTRIEIEANNFAAGLLMPEDLVRRAWQAFGSIQECARIFRVSVVAMSIRLTRLGLVQE
jgi:Zn-dependent peptidase ImmA (M78 family)